MISFSKPDNSEITVRYEDGRSFILTHKISIEMPNPLFRVKERNKTKMKTYGAYAWDYEPGPELKEWLDGKPLAISYQNRSVIFQMTHEDTALFRLSSDD